MSIASKLIQGYFNIKSKKDLILENEREMQILVLETCNSKSDCTCVFESPLSNVKTVNEMQK